MIDLEMMMVLSIHLFFMLCIPWTNYLASVNLLSYSSLLYEGVAQSDCTIYCECLYIIDAI